MGIYISHHIIIIDLQYLCLYLYFEGDKHNEIHFEQLIQNKNGQNPRWTPIFSPKFIICRGRVFFFCILLIISSCPMIQHDLSVILEAIPYLD